MTYNKNIFSYKYSSYLVFITFLIFNLILRLFSFTISTIDWDEITYLIMGKGVLNGKIPYVDLWDLKPLGIYIIYSLAIPIFGYTIECIRINSWLFVSLLSMSIYLHLKQYSKILALLAGLYISYLFILFPSGLSGNTEIFFLPLETIGLYYFINNNNKKSLLGSFFLGLAFLVKYIIIFDILVFFTFKIIVIIKRQKQLSKVDLILKILYLSLVFISPLFIVFFYYFLTNHTTDFFNSILNTSSKHSNVSPLYSRIKVLIYFYSNFFYIFIFLLSLIYFTKLKYKLSIKIYLFFLWVFTSSVGSVWTGFLYDHYFLSIIPPIVLLFFIILSFYKFNIKYLFNNLLSTKLNINIRMRLHIIFYFLILIFILTQSYLQERKLIKIFNKLPDSSKQIANLILQDGGGSIFISSGYHTPYVLLDQIPPVKYVQPNNYNELIFANNFNINIEDLVKEIESKKIKYIQWCDDFLPKDVLQGKNIYSDKINFSYYTLISKLISNEYYLLGSIKPNCSIYKHQ